MDNIVCLIDWMTSPDIKIGTKITEDDQDSTYHRHSFYEIFYILEGAVTHIINGEKEILEPGDIVFLRLGDAHSFLRDIGSICRHRDIIITVDQFEKSCNYISPDLLLKINERPNPFKVRLSFEEINALEKEITDIINIPLTSIKQKTSLINVLMVNILNYIIMAELTPTLSYPAWFEQLLSRFHMSTYLKEGLPAIIRPFNYDQSYICRLFKKYMGLTMSKYLCLMRLQYAATLLQSTDSKIITIANNMGFSSVSFFNSQFKKLFAHSPKEFRKLIKKI